MSAEINDDAIEGTPEPLNPHQEYISQLVEIRDRNTSTRDAVNAIRERLRTR